MSEIDSDSNKRHEESTIIRQSLQKEHLAQKLTTNDESASYVNSVSKRVQVDNHLWVDF